jgi:hypothetical protein
MQKCAMQLLIIVCPTTHQAVHTYGTLCKQYMPIGEIILNSSPRGGAIACLIPSTLSRWGVCVVFQDLATGSIGGSRILEGGRRILSSVDCGVERQLPACGAPSPLSSGGELQLALHRFGRGGSGIAASNKTPTFHTLARAREA